MKKFLYYILIFILAAVFLFSGWNIASYYLEGMSSQGRFDDLTQQMEDAKTQTNPPVYYNPPTQPTSPIKPTEVPGTPAGETIAPTEASPTEPPTEP